jgi:hypothetical protein
VLSYLDTPISPRKNLFCRSKSREQKSGTVPATNVGFQALKSDKSVYNNKGQFEVFVVKSSSRVEKRQEKPKPKDYFLITNSR